MVSINKKLNINNKYLKKKINFVYFKVIIFFSKMLIKTDISEIIDYKEKKIFMNKKKYSTKLYLTQLKN